MSIFENRKNLKDESIAAIEYQRLSANLDKIISAKRVPIAERMERYHLLVREVEELTHTCRSESEHMHFRRLMERVHHAEREIIS
ncbi:hypothetical protein [Aeromonas jandaei]|uniref:hypothetical protein n=1 Tax=Aeromonas jandaei TaxID=650 RepID=UPI003B9EA544